MTYAPKRLDVRESPNIQLSLAPKVTLDQQAGSFNGTAHSGKVFVGKVPNSCRVTHANVAHDLPGCGAPDD